VFVFSPTEQRVATEEELDVQTFIDFKGRHLADGANRLRGLIRNGGKNGRNLPQAIRLIGEIAVDRLVPKVTEAPERWDDLFQALEEARRTWITLPARIEADEPKAYALLEKVSALSVINVGMGAAPALLSLKQRCFAAANPWRFDVTRVKTRDG
jgi:hypothetical protein